MSVVSHDEDLLERGLRTKGRCWRGSCWLVAYAGTLACLALLGLFGAILLLVFLGIGHVPVLKVLLPVGFFAACGVIPMVYLAVGLRRYLRLTHARAIAIVSVLVAFLFVFTVAMAIEAH